MMGLVLTDTNFATIYLALRMLRIEMQESAAVRCHVEEYCRQLMLKPPTDGDLAALIAKFEGELPCKFEGDDE